MASILIGPGEQRWTWDGARKCRVEQGFVGCRRDCRLYTQHLAGSSQEDLEPPTVCTQRSIEKGIGFGFGGLKVKIMDKKLNPSYRD